MTQRKYRTIAAGVFKAQCLKLMDQVSSQHVSFRITKRGKVVAELIPATSEPVPRLFGAMKGSVLIQGDIVAPTGEIWEAEHE